MRPTVLLDSEVIKLLKEYARRSRTSFNAALNEILRRGLSAGGATRATRGGFVVHPHSGGFRPGVDPAKLNQLVDRLDAEEFGRKARSRR